MSCCIVETGPNALVRVDVDHGHAAVSDDQRPCRAATATSKAVSDACAANTRAPTALCVNSWSQSTTMAASFLTA